MPKKAFICLCLRSLFFLALTCLRQHRYRGDGLLVVNGKLAKNLLWILLFLWLYNQKTVTSIAVLT